MKPTPNSEVFSNPASASQLTDSEWIALHVPRFNQARPTYKNYKNFLREALQQACERLAPTAIVEVRAKKLPSFAEKILRKRGVYQNAKDPLPPDPLVRLTDLGGARGVTPNYRRSAKNLPVHRICLRNRLAQQRRR